MIDQEYLIHLQRAERGFIIGRMIELSTEDFVTPVGRDGFTLFSVTDQNVNIADYVRTQVKKDPHWSNKPDLANAFEVAEQKSWVKVKTVLESGREEESWVCAIRWYYVAAEMVFLMYVSAGI